MKKAFLITHRWLGLSLSLLFAAWFASGVVMMFVDDMPYLNARPEFWQKNPLLDFSAARFGFEKASGAELGMLEGRPVYKYRDAQGLRAVFADDGSRVSVDAAQALKIAEAWAGAPAEAPLKRIDDDQWTVYAGAFKAHRPLYKARIRDGKGTDVYVSSSTGEVVQAVNARQRFWGYLGPVIHWFYYTPIRRDRGLWNFIVISFSSLGSLMCLSGVVIGVWQFTWGKKESPYAERWLNWHHWLGLLFGFFAFTWVFSGLLSMSPFGWPWPDDVDEAAAMLAGGDLDVSRFKLAPAKALKILAPEIAVKRLELLQVAGRPYYLARADGSTTRLLAADEASPVPLKRLYEGQLSRDFEKALGQKALSSSLLEDYDAYYYSKRRSRPLPALKMVMGDAEKTTYYLDPSTGSVALRLGTWSRATRWLYSGLHRWDFPVLLKSIQLWYTVVLFFMLAGLALSATGVVISWKWLKRKSFFRS